MSLAKFVLLALLCSCNQQIYDAIYKQLVQTAMQESKDEKAFKVRNDGIETLRALCHGQYSSYERTKPCETK